MQRAYDQFSDNLRVIRELDALYIHLKDTLLLPNDLSDILRAEWVYIVSALDKLIHELVRIGMIESFVGTRVKTTKFLSFSISVDTHAKIYASTAPAIIAGPLPFPSEYWFEQEVVQKHKILSFQDPDKISEALSLIWHEEHKWATISGVLGIPEKPLKNKLKTIVIRRNQIVHEADIDPSTGLRTAVAKNDVDDVVTFIESLATTVFNLVK